MKKPTFYFSIISAASLLAVGGGNALWGGDSGGDDLYTVHAVTGEDYKAIKSVSINDGEYSVILGKMANGDLTIDVGYGGYDGYGGGYGGYGGIEWIVSEGDNVPDLETTFKKLGKSAIIADSGRIAFQGVTEAGDKGLWNEIGAGSTLNTVAVQSDTVGEPKKVGRPAFIGGDNSIEGGGHPDVDLLVYNVRLNKGTPSVAGIGGEVTNANDTAIAASVHGENFFAAREGDTTDIEDVTGNGNALLKNINSDPSTSGHLVGFAAALGNDEAGYGGIVGANNRGVFVVDAQAGYGGLPSVSVKRAGRKGGKTGSGYAPKTELESGIVTVAQRGGYADNGYGNPAGTFKAFLDPTMSEFMGDYGTGYGGIAFIARLNKDPQVAEVAGGSSPTVTSDNDFGIWQEDEYGYGGLSLLMREGGLVDEGVEISKFSKKHMINLGDSGIAAKVTVRDEAVVTASVAARAKPSGGGVTPANNKGIAVSYGYGGASAEGGVPSGTLIAREGDFDSGSGEAFKKIKDISGDADAGTLAFTAILTGASASNQGLYFWDGESPSLIARKGDEIWINGQLLTIKKISLVNGSGGNDGLAGAVDWDDIAVVLKLKGSQEDPKLTSAAVVFRAWELLD